MSEVTAALLAQRVHGSHVLVYAFDPKAQRYRATCPACRGVAEYDATHYGYDLVLGLPCGDRTRDGQHWTVPEGYAPQCRHWQWNAGTRTHVMGMCGEHLIVARGGPEQPLDHGAGL